MVTTFHHFEVLGPRADLDAWLGSLQDAGVCHLADALRDLEGESGIGRPSLEPEEVHAQLVRSEATRALRGVTRVLPPTPAFLGTERRPDWTLAPGGVGERELMDLHGEARDIAGHLRQALEEVRRREAEVVRLDALAAALQALERAGASEVRGHVVRLPRSPRRERRLRRRLARLHTDLLCAHGERSAIFVLRGTLPAGIAEGTAAFGAEGADLPPDLASLSPSSARGPVAADLAAARRTEADARLALTTLVAQQGERGRFLLDSLEDAEERTRARRHLASTDHVTAARLYVRPEDEGRLRERLHAAHGEAVVLRPLAESDDEPSLPRRVAAVPFAAFQGLLPRRFGDVAPATVLALVTPLAAGIVWADIAGGLLLLLAGGLLGAGAAVGSPRRDTALLAQVGGLIALVLGVLAGRALGPLGVAWFGAAWGVAPAAAGWFDHLPTWGVPFAGVLALLGAAALLACVWGLALAARARLQRRTARAAAAWNGALHYAVIAGLGAAVLGPASPFHTLWWLVPLGAAGILGGVGPRTLLIRLCLDLVGLLRLVAVAGGALLIFQLVLTGWLQPSPADVVVGALALVVAALALVADPAHLAMGVPYDLSLGGRRLSRPFEPFRRRVRGVLPALASAASGPAGDREVR